MDGIDNSVVASTTVPIDSDITTWLNSLDIPVHEGYVLNYFETTGVNMYNVVYDATVYIRYSVEGRYAITSYVNKDDIALDCKRSGWKYPGGADIEITFSKNFDKVEFDNHKILDLSATSGEDPVKPSLIGGNRIEFEDHVIKTPGIYTIELTNKGNKVGKVAWNYGFKPILVSVTDFDRTNLYKVVTNN